MILLLIGIFLLIITLIWAAIDGKNIEFNRYQKCTIRVEKQPIEEEITVEDMIMYDMASPGTEHDIGDIQL